jgi:hypothetical protein
MSAEPTPKDATIFADMADYEHDVTCVVMPCCGFTFDAKHTDDVPGPPKYTCPLCEPVEATA